MKESVNKKISIIIPVRTFESAREVLVSIEGAHYPSDAVEVFISQGFNPSIQRNLAAEESSGEILLFLDNDCIIAKDFLAKINISYSKETHAVAICGPAVSQHDNSFMNRLFSCVLSSFFAIFKKRAKFNPIGKKRIAGDHDIILCNFSIKRDVFLKERGFDERLYPNEENDFFHRLSKRGYKVLYDPDIKLKRVDAYPPIFFYRSIFRYGQGRSEQFFISPNIPDLQNFVPILFIFYLLLLPLRFSVVFSIPIAIYSILSFIESLYICIKHRQGILIFLSLPLAIFFTHLSYGFGQIFGLFKMFFIGKKIEAGPVSVITVKPFNKPFDEKVNLQK
jgi:glycosyltransferase involved in cell wall biosynthesis